MNIELDNYPYQYWNSAVKKGYSSTAIFSKIEPISHEYDMNIEKHDDEGRVITLEFDKYFLVTVYTPNAKRDLSRLDYREKEWDVDFLKFLKNLEKKKPVIFCGDFRQTDLYKNNDKSGLKKFIQIAESMSSFDTIEFGPEDIVRSELVKEYILARVDYEEKYEN